MLTLKITPRDSVEFDPAWQKLSKSPFFALADISTKTTDLTGQKFSLVAVWTMVAYCTDLPLQWNKMTYHELMFFEQFADFLGVDVPEQVSNPLQKLQERLFYSWGSYSGLSFLFFKRIGTELYQTEQSSTSFSHCRVYEHGEQRGNFFKCGNTKYTDFSQRTVEMDCNNYKTSFTEFSQKESVFVLKENVKDNRLQIFGKYPLHKNGNNVHLYTHFLHSTAQGRSEPLFVRNNDHQSVNIEATVFFDGSSESVVIVSPNEIKWSETEWDTIEKVHKTFSSDEQLVKWLEERIGKIQNRNMVQLAYPVLCDPYYLERYSSICTKCIKIGVKLQFFKLSPLQLFDPQIDFVNKNLDVFKTLVEKSFMCDKAMITFEVIQNKFVASVLEYQNNTVQKFDAFYNEEYHYMGSIAEKILFGGDNAPSIYQTRECYTKIHAVTNKLVQAKLK